MRSDSFIKTNNLHKKTLVANKPVDSLFWYIDGDDEDGEDSSDSQWLLKARRLQARRWRKIKHHTA